MDKNIVTTIEDYVSNFCRTIYQQKMDHAKIYLQRHNKIVRLSNQIR